MCLMASVVRIWKGMNNMNQNVLEWLEQTCERVSNKPAYSDVHTSITFGEAKRAAQAIGSGLAELVAPGSPVAVLSGRNVMTPVVFFGIVYSGCFYAPLDGTQPQFRLEQIMKTLQPKLVVADEENFELAQTIAPNCKVVSVEELMRTEVNEPRLVAIRKRSQITDPLYVIFTSGSTGIPKGVITSHESLMCYIDAYSQVMGIDEDDRFGNQSPLDYIAAIRDIYLPAKHGASTFIIPKNYFATPAQLFDVMNEQKITSVGWSVSALTIPVTMDAFEYTTPKYLKKVCFSGSVMPGRILRTWQQNLPETKFVNQYGPTEATASCTYYEVDHVVEEDEVLPIGEAYKNYRVFLLSQENEATPQGEIGEICVSGPILALGYYNDAERTAASFVQNPLNTSYRELMYRTGDLGRMREDGILEFHGRMDRQIKYLGHRVELGEIEVAAEQVDNLAECTVIYKKEKEQIMLFYVGECTKKDIAVKLRATLPGFMVPRKVIQLQEMPRLANGKTDMQALQNYTI